MNAGKKGSYRVYIGDDSRGRGLVLGGWVVGGHGDDGEDNPRGSKGGAAHGSTSHLDAGGGGELAPRRIISANYGHQGLL